MSLVVKLMIGGWATTLAMIGVCALHQSGKLSKLRRHIARWVAPLGTTTARVEKGQYPGRVQAD